MKKFIYCYKNKAAGLTNNVFIDALEPKTMAEKLKEELPLAKIDVLKALSEDEMYCLGVLDTLSLEVVAEKTFVFDVGSACCELLKIKDVQNA